MTNTFSKLAASTLTAGVGLTLAGCVTTPPTIAPAEPPVSIEEPTPDQTEEAQIEQAKTEFLNGLCYASEESLFVGSVDDDFGIGLAVCVLPSSANREARVTAVWEGEGGQNRTSCYVSECGDVLRFQRYTRFRYTELTLAWEAFGQSHTINETFNAEDFEAPADARAFYTWSSPELLAERSEPLTWPIETRSAPLSILRLEGILGQAFPTGERACSAHGSDQNSADGCTTHDGPA